MVFKTVLVISCKVLFFNSSLLNESEQYILISAVETCFCSFFLATQLLLAVTQILQNDLIDVSDLKSLLMNNDFYAANILLNEVLGHGPEHG